VGRGGGGAIPNRGLAGNGYTRQLGGGDRGTDVEAGAVEAEAPAVEAGAVEAEVQAVEAEAQTWRLGQLRLRHRRWRSGQWRPRGRLGWCRAGRCWTGDGGGRSSSQGGVRLGAVENGVKAEVVLDQGQWRLGQRVSSTGGSSGGSKNLWARGTAGAGAHGGLSV
jgi:hypothetical protein